MHSSPEPFPLLESGAEARVSASQIAIETFVRQNRFQWIYILLFNLGGQFLVPRVHPLWQWKLFTAVDLLLCLFRLPLDLKLRRPSGLTPFNVRLQMLFAIVHPFTMAFVVSSVYLVFGFDQISLVTTVLLVGYTFGALILMRSNLRVSRSVAIAYTLLPALTALWIGGFAGYAIGAHLLFVLLFCLLQGRLGNAEFWQLLHVNRDLQIARRRAESSIHIKGELIAKHTRQTIIAGERSRIAAEWHDTLLAGFSAIAWQLDLAEGDLTKDPIKTAHALRVARTMLHHYRTESRLVIADLLSSVHDPESLKLAVSRALEPFSQNRQVSITVTALGDDLMLPGDTMHQVLRICQEAVSNALQHANPQFVQIIISHETHDIRVEVQDDGSGFDTQAAVAGHYGLEIMKDRARRIGGNLEIQSTPGAGTKLSLTMPMTEVPKTQVTILIIEDQFFSKLALRAVIESQQDFLIVGEAGTGAAGIELFREHKPDVTLIDLRLPDTTGFEVIKTLRTLAPTSSIIVVSNLDGADHIRRATEAGASAYLTKDASSQELLQAIAAVVAGKPYFQQSLAKRIDHHHPQDELTPRERDVLEQLVTGLPNRDIGLRLGIAEKTVRIHLTSIFSKLGAADRTQAAVIALQRGVVDLPPDFVAGQS